MNETNVTLVGTVITDLRQRHTGEGARFVKFRMASNERRFDRVSQEWVDGDSLYVNVTCWRRLVKGVGAALGKGDPVIVVGRLYTREWEQDGHRRSSIEMDATAVGPDLARCIATIDGSRNTADADSAAGTDEELIEALPVEVPDDAEGIGATVTA